MWEKLGWLDRFYQFLWEEFFFLIQKDSVSLSMIVFLCTVFGAVSSNIFKVFISTNPSANVFVFGDFNIHHNDWLIYYDGTNRPSELCYDFSISSAILLK